MGSAICSSSPLLNQNLVPFLVYFKWEFSPSIFILVSVCSDINSLGANVQQAVGDVGLKLR